MKNRLANLHRIQRLDPERDWLEIFQTTVRAEFPWDMRMALNLGFNRCFSIPSIAKVLFDTGELIDRPQKRVDDTGLLMYELVLNGFDNERGRAVIQRINEMHSHHPIADPEYLYALGALVIVPMRWLERYGWRKPCCHERTAAFNYFRELGTRMGVHDIPWSYEALAARFDTYDVANLRPTDQAMAIERRTRMLLLTRIPRILAPLGNSIVNSLYDDRLRAAVHAPRAAWPIRAGVHGVLRARARLLRVLGRPRRHLLFHDGIRTSTYQQTYEIAALGTFPSAERHAHPR